MNIQFLGHSSFLITLPSGHSILFDPFISPNPKASHIAVDSLKPDFILVSHAHSDHIADLLSIAKQSQATVVANYEICEWVEKQGYLKTLGLNTGGSVSLPFGSVKLTSAAHSSSFPDGSYGGCAQGFIVKSGDKSFYYAGDTALTYDMKLIGKIELLDVAFLPIGGHFTMDAQEAALAAQFINCGTIVGMHYDTFPPIQIDHSHAVNIFAATGKRLLLPGVGDTITL